MTSDEWPFSMEYVRQLQAQNAELAQQVEALRCCMGDEYHECGQCLACLTKQRDEARGTIEEIASALWHSDVTEAERVITDWVKAKRLREKGGEG